MTIFEQSGGILAAYASFIVFFTACRIWSWFYHVHKTPGNSPGKANYGVFAYATWNMMCRYGYLLTLPKLFLGFLSYPVSVDGRDYLSKSFLSFPYFALLPAFFLVSFMVQSNWSNNRAFTQLFQDLSVLFNPSNEPGFAFGKDKTSLIMTEARGKFVHRVATSFTRGQITVLGPWDSIRAEENDHWVRHNLQTEGLSKRVKTIRCDSRYVPLDSDLFDVVFIPTALRFAYEDEDEQKDVYREALRCLKPEGTLITFAIGPEAATKRISELSPSLKVVYQQKNKLQPSPFPLHTVAFRRTDETGSISTPAARVSASGKTGSEKSPLLQSDSRYDTPATVDIPARDEHQKSRKESQSDAGESHVDSLQAHSLSLRQIPEFPPWSKPIIRTRPLVVYYTIGCLSGVFVILVDVIGYRWWTTFDVPNGVTSDTKFNAGYLSQMVTLWWFVLTEIQLTLKTWLIDGSANGSLQLILGYLKMFVTVLLSASFVSLVFWGPGVLAQLYLADPLHMSRDNIKTLVTFALTAFIVTSIMKAQIRTGGARKKSAPPKTGYHEPKQMQSLNADTGYQAMGDSYA